MSNIQPEVFAIAIIWLLQIFAMVFLQMKSYKSLDVFELFVGIVISLFISIFLAMAYKIVFVISIAVLILTIIVLCFKEIAKIILMRLPKKEGRIK